MQHKYIARIRTKSGKWRYVYKDADESRNKKYNGKRSAWEREMSASHVRTHINMNELKRRDQNPNARYKKNKSQSSTYLKSRSVEERINKRKSWVGKVVGKLFKK